MNATYITFLEMQDMAEIRRCADCKKIIGDAVTTCPHCNSVQKLPAQTRNTHSNSRSEHGQVRRSPSAMESEATRKKFAQIEEKHSSRRNLWGASASVFVLASLGLLATSQFTFYALIPFFGVIVSLAGYQHVRWTKDEYYSLPGSRNESGEHRCVHCGKRGIFNRGEYKTDLTHANCSQCKRHLFTE
jgi:hypothetical protein